MHNRIITVTTDFGLKDAFVAQMKGVILSINPDITIVDITHSIHPQDIDEAAYIIGSSFRYFPSGTIHVVVVDPGVGSERKALILEAGGHFFVGPDNGVFSYILNKKGDCPIRQITEGKYMRSKESSTFQGRDLFAPVAAWLSKGIAVEEFGPLVTGAPKSGAFLGADELVTLPVAQPQLAEGCVYGEIIYIDSFGNAITNIKKETLTAFDKRYNVEINNIILQPVMYYAQSEVNSLGCLVNSSGYLELFVRNSNAAKEFNLIKGHKVIVRK